MGGGGGWLLIYKTKLAHPPYFCMIADIPNNWIPLGIFVFGLRSEIPNFVTSKSLR